tara:strand:+ start:828 stop:2147 length:1320 start_codon:yes stop_codon:yes gene_type:complete
MPIDTTIGMPSAELVKAISEHQDEPSWLLEKRLDAWAIFQNTPMPARTDEMWRRTDLRGIDPVNFVAFKLSEMAKEPHKMSVLPEGIYAGNTVQTDWAGGKHYINEHLISAGVIFTDLASAAINHSELFRQYVMPSQTDTNSLAKFTSLNAALWSGGSFLYVPEGVQIDLPLHRLHTMTKAGTAVYSHTTIVLGKSSKVLFIEEQSSEAQTTESISVSGVDIYAGEGAQLDYVHVQNWGEHTASFSNVRAVGHRNSTVNLTEFSLGSALGKNCLDGYFPDSGSSSHMWGLTLLDGTRHIDHETKQHHVGPHTFSDLMYKGVLRDRARSVFYGMILVEEEAHQSNSYQQNDNLLLSNESRADSIPGMEIKTYDVRCTHGATVGKIDADELFYLMSRGFTRQEAEALAVRGYVEPVLDRVPNQDIRKSLEVAVFEKAVGSQ